VFAAGFFLLFGLRSLLNAARGTAPFDVQDGQGTIRKAVLVSLLNPGVIFDTIVLVGGVAAQYDDLTQRAIFSLGAVTASSLWFATLAVASYSAGRYVTGAQVWRILDLVVGLLMLILAATLVQDAAGFAAARWG